MRKIEPFYNSYSNEQISNQIDAILECGYVWVDEIDFTGFQHSSTKLVLNIDRLYSYSPEDIIDMYNNVWSKDSVVKMTNRKNKVKVFKSLYTFILSNLLFFFIKWEYALTISLFLLLRSFFLIYQSNNNKDIPV